MKLAIPAVGIVVAAASCCCCGDLASKIEELANGGAANDDVVVVEPGTPSTPPAATGPTLSGACGRFGSMSMAAPSGFSILACSDQGASGSLLLQGSATPKDACATMRSWATGAGWNVTTEASMGDTVSLIFGKGGEQMTIACTNMTGATTIAISLSNQ